MSKKKDFSDILNFQKETISNDLQQESISVKGKAPHVIDTISSSRPIIRNIEIDKIIPSSSQPRKTFKEDSLKELANSIKEKGLLQEIAVKRIDEGIFELIWGERRWRACKMLNWKTIPCRIYDSSDDSEELSLIENIQRDDLLPEEFSVCVKNIILKKGYTQEDMATIIGKSQGTISKCISIANFVQSPGVLDEIIKLRKEESNINFEILFLASSRGTAEQGLEFLRDILKNKIPTKIARKLDRKVRADVVSTLRKLKSFRSRLDFSFLEAAQKEDPEGKIKKEIDLTIDALKQSMEKLINIKNSLI